jgi:hypothetical protein
MVLIMSFTPLYFQKLATLSRVNGGKLGYAYYGVVPTNLFYLFA